jgi:hypothetical protein
MSSQSHDSMTRRFRDDEASRILDHAIRIDAARRTGMTVNDLHDIAREIGISPQAVDDALHALEASGWRPEKSTGLDSAPVSLMDDDLVVQPSRWRSRLAHWLRPVILPLIGMIGGVTTSDYVVDLMHPQPLLSGGTAYSTLLVGGSIALLVHHWRRGTHRRFQVDLIGLWSGFVIGWLIAHESLGVESFVVMGGAWAGLALIGRWALGYISDDQGEPGTDSGLMAGRTTASRAS